MKFEALMLAGLAACVLAPVATAQTVYIAGTRPITAPATVSPSEALLMTGDPNAYIVQYPRELAPLIGSMPVDQSVAVGVANVPELHDGDRIVCVSQGCLVSNQIKTTAQVTRTNYGDPTGSNGLLVKLGLKPQSSNPDIAFEYDGIADAPDYPNLLSWANAVMGAAYTHNTYSQAAAEGPTKTYGDHTIILAQNLPLTRPLRVAGVDSRIVDQLDKALKPVIDSGYKRGHQTKQQQSVSPSVGKGVPSRTGAQGHSARHAQHATARRAAV